MPNFDYYEVMGLDDNASSDEIKKSYRRLARKYHPDVSKEKDAEDRFKELSEAYEVLKDKDKRTEYDQVRKYGEQGAGWRSAQDWGQEAHYHAGSFEPNEMGSEFFESLFGQRGRARTAYSFAIDGDDIHHRLEVTLEEAFKGSTRGIRMETTKMDQQGRPERVPTSINVTIPKGVMNGQQLRLKGKGSPGISGGNPGDLYLEIALVPHKVFQVDGRDLFMNLPVAPWEIMLGDTVEVPTFNGYRSLLIPANSKSGQKIRILGQGLPGKIAGDLYVTLQVVVPEVKDDSDKASVEKLKERMNFDPRQNLRANL